MNALNDYEETIALGEKLGASLQPGDILLLEGDLGAGKTTLTQGLAKGLGVTEFVNSPTFVIINEYFTGRLPLYHMDLYRVEEEAQLYDLGVEEYFYGNGVCVVEWPEIARAFLPEDFAQLSLAHDGNARTVELSIHGDCAHIKEAYDEYFSH